MFKISAAQMVILYNASPFSTSFALRCTKVCDMEGVVVEV